MGLTASFFFFHFLQISFELQENGASSRVRGAETNSRGGLGTSGAAVIGGRSTAFSGAFANCHILILILVVVTRRPSPCLLAARRALGRLAASPAPQSVRCRDYVYALCVFVCVPATSHLLCARALPPWDGFLCLSALAPVSSTHCQRGPVGAGGWGGCGDRGGGEGKPLPPTHSLTPVRARVRVRADANEIAPVERLAWCRVG